MQDVFEEILIKRKKEAKYTILCILAIIIIFAGLVIGMAMMAGIILVPVGAFMAFYFNRFRSVEYEYIYVAGQIDVDRVSNAASRKRLGTYAPEDLIVLAPKGSSNLGVNKKDIKVVDYTSGEDGVPCYAAVYNIKDSGQVMLLMELNETVVTDMRRRYPRKVFTV